MSGTLQQLRRFPARGGFTLIELMIVVAIMGVVSVGVFSSTDILRRHGSTLKQAVDRAADEALLDGQWRRDVLLAHRVAIEDEGRAMRLERVGEDGVPLPVRYSLGPQGAVLRQTGDGATSATARLAFNLATLRFTPQGRGFALHSSARWDDGLDLHTTSERTIYATPLLAGRGGQP